MNGIPLLRIQGRFFRAVRIDRLDDALDPPAERSAGRYHRPGQPALYVSPQARWAAIAVSRYMREDGVERAVLPLEIDAAMVLDQRDEEACRILGIDRDRSNNSWREALATDTEAGSWINADAARKAGADGIVDRSRLIPGGWHVTLFRWNSPSSPNVRIVGAPVPVDARTPD